MKCKVFISCMGWGHLIREIIILRELKKKIPNLSITIQSRKNSLAKKFLKEFNFIEDENLVKFYSKNNGSIDLLRTKKYYLNYKKKSNEWIDRNLNDRDYDFFISDLSPEAVKVGRELRKPTFSICHFTWDWFFSQFLPRLAKQNIINLWEKQLKLSSKFFFPPLTPISILNKYKNHFQVPFIVSNLRHQNSNIKFKKKYNVLLMDSGDKLMKNNFKKILKKNQNSRLIKFFHPSSFGNYKNTFKIPKNKLLTDYIKTSDLVIARPGFNTISSVLKERKPSIYFLSDDNPEINWNIHQLHTYDLTHSVKVSHLINNFEDIIKSKIENENNKFLKNIIDKNFKFNGHKVISSKIFNLLK